MEWNSFRKTKEQPAQLQLTDEPRPPGICGGLFPISIFFPLESQDIPPAPLRVMTATL